MISKLALLLVVLLSVGTNSEYIGVGKEYSYAYTVTVNAGSKDYLNFASSFNLTGVVRVQKTDATHVNVKLEDLKFGAHNGEHDEEVGDEFTFKSYQQLNPLMEPFTVVLDGNNMASGIVLSENIPEWARNIQRGLATTLQLDSAKATGNDNTYYITEKTINGECPTVHQVTKTETGAVIRKQRSHEQCDNRVMSRRKPGIWGQYCPDENTRNAFNSSSYGVYRVGSFKGEPALTFVMSGSALWYNIFGTNGGHEQYSWVNSNFVLTDIKSGGFRPIPAPSSPKTHDNLRYVFSFTSSYTDDSELQIPTPYFEHYAAAPTDETSLNAIVENVYETIVGLGKQLESTTAFDDLKEFHNSPLTVVPPMSLLPYEKLKGLYARFKKDDKYTTTKLFLDALLVAGTRPGSLLIRDIIEGTTDTRVIANLIVPFANYVRKPTEKLLKEYESLVTKTGYSKQAHRMIELSFANLVGRVCATTGCTKSGYLDKYVKYFSDQYDNGNSFEEKTSAVLCLKNIGQGSAISKLLAIAANKNEDRSVRVQAIVGTTKSTDKEATDVILPIFYDTDEHHEVRTVAALVYLMNHAEEQTAVQMVRSMWSEKCKYVKNFMYTLFEGLAHSTRPCLSKIGSYAKSAFAFFPPHVVDRTLSGNYIRDYHDRKYNFGHMTHLVVQKSGDSFLPSTLYGSLNGQLAGYGATYFSFFVRIEGLGRQVAERMMSMMTGQVNFDDLKDVFSKINISPRPPTPLRVELALTLHGKVVAYHGVDSTTITKLPEIIKKLQEMKSTYEVEVSRLFLIGSVRFEQPTEFGTPISVTSSLMALGNANVNTNREKTATGLSQKSDIRVQGQIFGISQVSNHFPAFGSMHTVQALRTLRFRLPRHFNFNIDTKSMSLSFGVDTPTKDDPIKIRTHALAATLVKSDVRADKDGEIVAILKESCPDCSDYTMISKGKEFRTDRQVGLPDVSRFKVFEGVKRGVKYFGCERPHTRYATLKRIARYFGENDKNAGGLSITRVLLGLQYMRDSIFLSPQTEACGMEAYYSQDPDSPSVFSKVEGNVKVKYEADPNKKMGMKLQYKGQLSFIHTGSDPQTRVVESTGQIVVDEMSRREVNLKFKTKDPKSGKSYMLCIDGDAKKTKATDFLAFDGQNEPSFERHLTFKWGEEPAGGAGKKCPENAAYIKTTRKSHRSEDQINEAKSNNWPYKQCREQKNSPAWPGQITPPTLECMLAAIDQTNLRESNITIEYQVDVEARNRWKKPAVAVAAMLLPYWDTTRSTAAAHAHGSHENHGGSSGEYVKGSIEMDVSLRKDDPTVDVHWHASHGEEHFHNVDLDILPGPLKAKPVFARFSQYYYTLFNIGAFGYCGVSPSTVFTFDNLTYSVEQPSCPVLLAGDCDEKPRFAVFTQKLSPSTIGLTIYLGEHKLEAKDLNTISIDGKPVTLSDSVYTDDDEEKLFKFIKINPTYVGILSEKLSVFIGYSGEWATVTAGSRYRATACGLCGNYDSNKYNDLTGPDNKIMTSPQELVKAYTSC